MRMNKCLLIAHFSASKRHFQAFIHNTCASKNAHPMRIFYRPAGLQNIRIQKCENCWIPDASDAQMDAERCESWLLGYWVKIQTGRLNIREKKLLKRSFQARSFNQGAKKHTWPSVSYITANIYCKSRNLPNSDVRNNCIDLR